MRSIYRTLEQGLVRDVAALATAVGFVGASFGAIAVADGNPLWVPVAMSLLVFAGGAQFMAIGVVAAGGGVIAAVIGAVLLNLRMLPFGLAVGPAVGNCWWQRVLGSHVITDESTAFAMARSGDPVRSRQAFWLSGGTLFVVWNICVALGGVASGFIGDTDAFGIDAAFPAGLLALILPSLKDRDARRAAVCGVAIAVATAPFLPPGIPVLLGLAGVGAAVIPVPRKKVARP